MAEDPVTSGFLKMTPMSQNFLDTVIKKHKNYLEGRRGGARAILQYYNLSGLDFGGQNLSQADFTGSKLYAAKMAGCNLTGVNFFAADLRSADLTKAVCRRADFRGSDVSGADLTGADLTEADLRQGKIMKKSKAGGLVDKKRISGDGAKTLFKGTKLNGALLTHAQASETDFTDANLTGCDFRNANLEQTNFSNANLTDADLSGSNMAHCNMRHSIIAGTALGNTERFGIDTTGATKEQDMGSRLESIGRTLPELLEEHTLWVKTAGREGIQLDLSGYDLRYVLKLNTFPLTAIKAEDANFLGQKLNQVALQSAHLDYADFRDCLMEEADLRGSSLKYAQMSRANLQHARLCPLEFKNPDGSKRLQRANISGANLRYANLAEADLRDCILMGADLTCAVLTHCNLSRADLSGAILTGAVIDGATLDGAIIDLSGVAD